MLSFRTREFGSCYFSSHKLFCISLESWMWLSIKHCPEKYVKPGVIAAEQAMHIFLHPDCQRRLEFSGDRAGGSACSPWGSKSLHGQLKRDLNFQKPLAPNSYRPLSSLSCVNWNWASIKGTFMLSPWTGDVCIAYRRNMVQVIASGFIKGCLCLFSHHITSQQWLFQPLYWQELWINLR